MTQGLYRDHGIVLRTWRLGEADRIASLLTRRNGKVRAVAKGARKTRSRFGARVEPGAHLALQLYAGRSELETLAQAEAVEPMRAIRADLCRLGRAAVLLEVADHAVVERQPNEPLYHLLLGALRSLEDADRPLVVSGFVLKLLALEGVQPDLTHCIGCGADRGPRGLRRGRRRRSLPALPGRPGRVDRGAGRDAIDRRRPAPHGDRSTALRAHAHRGACRAQRG